MRGIRLHQTVWMAVMGLLLIFTVCTEGRAYTFKLILDGTAPSGGAELCFACPPTMNNKGRLAFVAYLDGALNEGVFTSDGRQLTTIADTRGPLTHFAAFPIGPAINDKGEVVFVADGNGIFVGDGGPLTTINDPNGPFSAVSSLPTLNNKGTVVFYAVLDGVGKGLFIWDQGQITTLYDTSGPFFDLDGAPAINDKGLVAFFAGLRPNDGGLFTGDGGPPTTIAMVGGAISHFFSRPSINERGTVVFAAALTTGGSAIFTGDGGPLTLIADTSGPFSDFLPDAYFPGINKANQVAFMATLRAGGNGIFTGPDPLADKVIATGDPLLGSTVIRLGFFRGLNDAGQIAFWATLANGSGGWFRADP
jgi:hypothetical protein